MIRIEKDEEREDRWTLWLMPTARKNEQEVMFGGR